MSAVTILTEKESSWIGELASRLRLIQADAASAPANRLEELLQEEVARHLKDVPSANRQRFINALLERFPVGGNVAQSAINAPAPSTPPPKPAPESIEETFERFLSGAEKISVEKRNAFTQELKKAGFKVSESSGASVEVSDELCQKLGLTAGQPLPLNRLVELAVFLIDALTMVDKNALKTMDKLASKSRLLKRSEDLRTAALRFLAGEKESMEPQWKEMRELLGGLFAAMQGAGKDFGRQYLERFSPSAIEDVVQGEARFGWMPGQSSKKECCWDKYKKLAEEYATADLIDRRIRDCLGAFADKTAAPGR